MMTNRQPARAKRSMCRPDLQQVSVRLLVMMMMMIVDALPMERGDHHPPSRAQFDGPGGDDDAEEDDEDAINSDLDDPEENEAEENDAEDAVGQVMLCTYDKVQRVKNKWKCTLKDGILTTGGKE